MTVELRHLRALVAISDAGTITDAAPILGVTQPALSRTLEQLETKVGARLVERTTRRLLFTPAGERLCEQARHIIDRVDRAVAAVGAEPRPLRIGFGRGALGKLTMPLLRGWRTTADAQPQAEASGNGLQVRHHDDPEAALHRSEIDVAFLRGEPHDGASLELLPLYQEPRLAVVPRHHRLARRPGATLADLVQDTVVLCSSAATTTADLWPTGTPPRTTTVANNAEWLTTIAMGDAVGVTARGTQDAEAPDGVVYLPILDASPVTVYLAWTRPPSHPAVPQWREHTLRALHRRRRQQLAREAVDDHPALTLLA